MSDEGDVEDGGLDMFNEPEGYFKPERQPTIVSHTTLSGQILSLRLIGHSPLWGHLLWNAGRTIAEYLETHAVDLIGNKTVLELGAGAGLPSLICALSGAKQVLVTDYPDADLIENLRHNIRTCSNREISSNICAEGYLWGAPTTTLIAHLPSSERNQGFDLLILADLLFNHSEHGKLLSTVQQTLKHSNNSQALVFFTPYRPWLIQKDLAFFDLAREGGFAVAKIFEHELENVMFENDPGDERLRRTVFGYRLTWAASTTSDDS